MMPRSGAEAMEGGYSSYRAQQQQGSGGGPSARGGSSGGNNPQANSNVMGMPPQGYDAASEMRTARYGMGHPSMQHHHGMGASGMDPSSALAMGGYHRGHEGLPRGAAEGMMPGNYQGYSSEMSPSMQRMTAGNMYAMQQQQQPPQPQQPPQGGNSPNFPGGNRDAAGMSEMGAGSEGRANREGQMAASGGPTGNLSQADREEELLLNLLIARRQRSRMSGDPAAARQEGYYADELLRLRQGRAAAAAAAAGHGMAPGQARGPGGGTLPPMPGMPPLYMDHPVNTLPAVSGHSMNVGIAGNSYSDLHHPFKSDVAMNLPIQDGVDQRIDRSPPHLMDARSQDMMMMRDFSGRGMKRSPYDMGPGMHMHHPNAGMPMKYHMQMQGMEMPGAGAQSGKKKRSHKKKPADMPRRPLSAYNLFFSEERERILKEIDGKDEGDVKKEDKDKEEEKDKEGGEAGGDEESSKPKALLRPLIPNQKKRRPHRKTHGKISFQQLARMVGERWKALPEDRRKYYQELAQEDMKRQKQAMEEYYAKQQALKEGRKPHEMGQSDDPSMFSKPQSMETQVNEGIPEHTSTM